MPAASRTLRSFEKVVRTLGGTSATARLTRRTPQQVVQWRNRYNAFPAELYPIVRDKLAEEGLTAADKVFNFDRA